MKDQLKRVDGVNVVTQEQNAAQELEHDKHEPTTQVDPTSNDPLGQNRSRK